MEIRKQLKSKNNDEIPALKRFQVFDAIRLCNVDRDKALIAFLYLTGARIEEVVKFKRKGELVGKPLRKKHIEIRDSHIIVHSVRTLKQSKAGNRTIPITRNSLENGLIQIFLRYHDTLKEEDDYLFNITRQRGHQILQKVGIFPHLLRHSRNTHLVQDYDFTVPQLQQFNGWKRADTPSHYVHLKVQNLLDKMSKIQ